MGLTKRSLVAALLLTILGAAAACSSAAARTAVAPTWITPDVSGDTVSIASSEVADARIVHFSVTSDGDRQTFFMAYQLNDKQYVRADACVPCRSINFSLAGDRLVCGSCGTVFSAVTGAGVAGSPGCQGYPKASVPFTMMNGRLVMAAGDLATGWSNTLKSGLP